MNEDNLNISRRKILAGLSAVGAAGAGAGLGTSAFFSDEESFDGNTIAAGHLDLKVDWEEHYYSGIRNLGEDCDVDARLLGSTESPEEGEVGFPAVGDPIVAVPEGQLGAFMDCTLQEETEGMQDVSEETGVITLDDVKPGDFGEITICYGISDNPGYVQLDVEELLNDENGLVEPEIGAEGEDDEPGDGNMEGELADALQIAAWYDPTGDNVYDEESGDAIFVGEEGATLNDLVGGLQLDPTLAGGSPGWETDGENCHVPGLNCVETLYLSETEFGQGDPNGTKLFEVDLNDDEEVAVLSELQGSPLGENFPKCDAIAATAQIPGYGASPPGDAESNSIYVVDKNTARLGRYDLETDTFEDLGDIDGISSSDEIVLLSFDPAGTLWAVGQSNGQNIYEFTNIEDQTAAVGSGTSVSGVNVSGADIAYDSNGELYLYSNNEEKLYTIDRSSGNATLVGTTQSDKGLYTGLAIQNAGTGDIVGSSTSDDSIYVLDKMTGGEGTEYDMRLSDGGGGFEDQTYSYGSGDMTVNQLCPEYCIALEWRVPRETGNEIQSDRLQFDLTLRTEQCRNNDDPF